MTQISQQLVDFMHRCARSHRETYHASTRFTKMEMPRFTREDVVGWILKCKSYFNLDKTPEENKVTMARLVLDELGYQWFDGIKKGAQNHISWHMFIEGIRIWCSTTL